MAAPIRSSSEPFCQTAGYPFTDTRLFFFFFCLKAYCQLRSCRIIGKGIGSCCLCNDICAVCSIDILLGFLICDVGETDILVADGRISILCCNQRCHQELISLIQINYQRVDAVLLCESVLFVVIILPSGHDSALDVIGCRNVRQSLLHLSVVGEGNGVIRIRIVVLLALLGVIAVRGIINICTGMGCQSEGIVTVNQTLDV